MALNPYGKKSPTGLLPLKPPSAPGYPNRPHVAKTGPVPPKLGPAPMPFDPGYQTTLAGINRQQQGAGSNLLYGQQELGRQYGITAQGTIDPGNPYSLASTLQQSYLNNTRTTKNSYAGRGQLYSGAYQNARNQDTEQFGRSYNDLTNRYRQANQSLVSQYSATADQLAQQKVDAGGQAVRDAIARGIPIEDAWAMVYGTPPPVPTNKVITGAKPGSKFAKKDPKKALPYVGKKGKKVAKATTGAYTYGSSIKPLTGYGSIRKAHR